MSIERLTVEDRIMLWPDEIWPQDIGALAILDGAGLLDPDGRLRTDAVRAVVASRLHLFPRFRQVLQVPPPNLGGPFWADAPAFDLADHVGVVRLAAPSAESQLLRAVEELRRRRMDRSRPLWEMWFLTGLSDKRVGLFLRTHHCIADGMAGVATLAGFLDVDPDVVAAPAEPWTPAPWPSEAALLADHKLRRSSERRRALASLAHPLGALRRTAEAWPAMRELIAEKQLPPTSLDRTVGPGRALALVRSELDLVKTVAHANGAKVNDVLLAATAGGLRELLRGRGELRDGLVARAYVPVTLRHGEGNQARGNNIAQMMVPLPVGVDDPVLMLRQIAGETAERKRRARPSIGKLPHRGIVGRAFLTLINRQRVNVTTADLPGPPVPLYIAGARLLELFPILPLIGRVSLGVGALSYAGQFNITAVADQDAYPDIEVFTAGALDALRVLAGRTGARDPSARVA